MRDEDESMPLSRRQRLSLTAFIVGIVAISSVDVVGDVFDGAGLEHVGIEAFGILLGIAGVTWIWTQNRRLEATSRLLRGRLDVATAEAFAWRTKSQEFAQGISRAIDDQFKAWQLTGAEKEVALLLLKGLSLKEVSNARGTSERTARQQAHEIYRKSGLGGRAEFSAFFLEELLVPIG